MATGGEKRGVSDVELSDNTPENTPQPKIQKIKDIIKPDVTYSGTAIQDVYTIDPLEQVPQPCEIQTDLEDWSSPVLLIISRNTRDLYFQFLHKLTTENKALLQQTTALSTSSKTNYNQSPVQDERSDDTETKISLEDLTTEIAKFNSAAEQTKLKLDKIKQKFTTDNLIQDLKGEEEFHDFKTIRKQISSFLGAIKNINKSFKEISSGNSDYICKVTTNLIPNKLDKSAVQDNLQNLKYSVEQTNFNLMHASILQGIKDVNVLNAALPACKDIITAKAWRCSKKSAEQSNIQLTSRTSVQHRQQISDTDTQYKYRKYTSNRTRQNAETASTHRDQRTSYGRLAHRLDPEEEFPQRDHSPVNNRHRDYLPYDDRHHHYNQDQHYTRQVYYTRDREPYRYDRNLHKPYQQEYNRNSYYFNSNRDRQEHDHHKNRQEHDRHYLDAYYDLEFPPLHKPSETQNLPRRP